MSNSDSSQPPGEQPAREQVFCPNCNGGNPPGAANCTWCGKPLGVAAATNDAPDSATVATVYSPAPSTTQQQEYQPQPQPQPYQPPATGYTQPAQSGYADAPQYPQPSPVVTAPPPAKSGSGRKIALIVGGVLLGLLLLCGILFGSLIAGVFGITQPAVDSGEKFMAALRDGEYDRAFELSTPTLQQELGDSDTLRDALQSKQPTAWTFTSRKIENDLATLGGTTTYANNEPGRVEMELRKVGNDWLVSFINLE